jgi:GTF2I-like repeat
MYYSVHMAQNSFDEQLLLNERSSQTSELSPLHAEFFSTLTTYVCVLNCILTHLSSCCCAVFDTSNRCCVILRFDFVITEQATGFKHCSYKKQDVTVEGLPPGVCFAKPSSYGTKTMLSILERSSNIRFSRWYFQLLS